MQHAYRVSFSYSTRSDRKKAKDLSRSFSGIEIDFDSDLALYTVSDDADASRALLQEAQSQGLTCGLNVTTDYGPEDALAGELGIFGLGPTSREDLLGKLPKDAFDFSTGCPRCGLGAAVAKPHLMSKAAVRSKLSFIDCTTGGRVLMRSEIANAIIEATGQPWCMRHPMIRDGSVVEEWMEPVPCATMPPLSPKSEGVRIGNSTSGSFLGEPPEIIPPCPVCGRNMWDYARDTPTRLVYTREAIEAAQKHAVVAMYEPRAGFPELDPVGRTFDFLGTMPLLLFNRDAIGALLKHMKYPEGNDVRDTALIEPVFAEDPPE